MTHLKLLLEYDGTDFSGWQSQRNGRTVQDVLEEAITRVTGESVRVAGGGRTDAGVHAIGQVASVSLEKQVSGESLRRSLNGVLPDDVVVSECTEVHPSFHARFAATSRTYRYTIVRVETAIRRKYVWHVGWNLDRSLLAECATLVRGEHDFRSFAKTGSDVRDWSCAVISSAWEESGDALVYSITANRFLYGMVRALVGTMVEVARGYRTFEDFKNVLAARDRREAGVSAPPHGLCLVRIEYGNRA